MGSEIKQIILSKPDSRKLKRQLLKVLLKTLKLLACCSRVKKRVKKSLNKGNYQSGNYENGLPLLSLWNASFHEMNSLFHRGEAIPLGIGSKISDMG